MHQANPPPESHAKTLFEAWLHANDAGAQCDWTEFLAVHPAFADRLQQVRADYERAYAVLVGIGTAPAGDQLATMLDELGRTRDTGALTPLGTIARGGMGVIERVWDARLRRPLARKLVPCSIHGPHSSADRRRLSRFLQEARVSSQLQHPGILPIHDIGVDEQGHPYFTMPIVHGDHLGTVIRKLHAADSAWSLPRVLQVIVAVSEVVAYAHSKGVVHRDLKPQNVMVGRFGETFVMDWGVAKLIDCAAAPATNGDSVVLDSIATSTDVALNTLPGDVLGTPSYMAPEQASGALECMGPSIDQYAIGAILYEVIANRRPYSDAPETDTPEQLIATVRRAPPTPLERLVPKAPAELLAICAKAMQRDPIARYASVEALGTDLRAFLEQRVVRAHDTGPLASLGKWVRRHRGVAALLVLIVLLVAGGLAVVLALEKKRGARLQAANDELRRVDGELTTKVDELRREAYQQDLAFVQRAMAAGVDGGEVQRVLDDCDSDLRGWEWHYLRSLADQSQPVGPGYRAIAVSADGRYLAASNREYEVVLRELATGREVRRLACRAMVDTVSISTDNRYLAVASRDQMVRVLDIDSGAQHEVLVGAGPDNDLAFIADSAGLLTRMRSAQLAVIDPSNGTLHPGVGIATGTISALATHANGRVAVGDDCGAVSVFAGPDGALLTTWKVGSKPIVEVAFQGGDVIVASDVTRTVWRRALTGDAATRLGSARPTGEASRGQAFDPHGRLWGCGSATSIELLDLNTGQWLLLHGHTGRVEDFALTADGELVSTGEDGMTRRWRPREQPLPRAFRGLRGEVVSVSIAPDGHSVAAAVGTRVARLPLDGTERVEVEGHVGRIRRLRHTRDGTEVIAVGAERCLRLFDGGDLRTTRELFLEVAEASVLALAPDGTLLAGADRLSWDNMGLWDLAQGGGARPFSVAYVPADGCFSPDGAAFALAATDGCLHLLDTASRSERHRVVLSDLRLASVAWSADGALVAAGGRTPHQGWPIYLVEPRTGEVRGTLTGPSTAALCLRFTPDGRLVSGHEKGHVRVWDVARRRSLLELNLEGESRFSTLDLSSDGRILAVGTTAGEVFVWRLDR